MTRVSSASRACWCAVLSPCGRGGWALGEAGPGFGALAVRVILMPWVGELRRCVQGLRVTGQSGAHARVRRRGTCGQVRGVSSIRRPVPASRLCKYPAVMGEGWVDHRMCGGSESSTLGAQPAGAWGAVCGVGRRSPGDLCAAYAWREALPMGRVQRGVCQWAAWRPVSSSGQCWCPNVMTSSGAARSRCEEWDGRRAGVGW